MLEHLWILTQSLIWDERCLFIATTGTPDRDTERRSGETQSSVKTKQHSAQPELRNVHQFYFTHWWWYIADCYVLVHVRNRNAALAPHHVPWHCDTFYANHDRVMIIWRRHTTAADLAQTIFSKGFWSFWRQRAPINAVKCFAIGADSVMAINDGLGLESVLLPELKTRHKNEFFSPCLLSSPWKKAATSVKI